MGGIGNRLRLVSKEAICQIGEYNMPALRENCLGGFVRRKYPDLKDDNFQAYNNLVSKLRSRAKARDFDLNNLTQEQFNSLIDAKDLHRGEKVHMSWDSSSMCNSMVRDGELYIKNKTKYFHKVVVNGNMVEGTGTNFYYLCIPSTVKYLARSMKWGNAYLENASMLDSKSIELLKKQLVEESMNADVSNIPNCPPFYTI